MPPSGHQPAAHHHSAHHHSANAHHHSANQDGLWTAPNDGTDTNPLFSRGRGQGMTGIVLLAILVVIAVLLVTL